MKGIPALRPQKTAFACYFGPSIRGGGAGHVDGVGQHGMGTRSRGPFMNTNPYGRQAGRGQPAAAGRWLVPLSRHPWYLASAAIAVIALMVGGAALLLEGNGGPSQPV